MSIVKKTLLKGGSLAGTYLIETGKEKFVRKQISTRDNREYGYQRWYSQMKRIQRYNQLFPGLFPDILRCGYDDNCAFFDLEFLETAVNCHDYISKTQTNSEIDKVFSKIIAAMNRMHSKQMTSSPESIDLYIQEEIRQKIDDALVDEKFKKFFDYDYVVFKGKDIEGLSKALDSYIKFGKKNYKVPVECFTHGNITLENIMYCPVKEIIYFIDPYDENIIDSVCNEYSQLLQSCNSHYEIYNSSDVKIDENKVITDIEIPPGIKYFNILFSEFLERNLSEQQMQLVSFFEISQFVRMLPFKMHVDKEKMILFYALASNLFSSIKEKYNL